MNYEFIRGFLTAIGIMALFLLIIIIRAIYDGKKIHEEHLRGEI